MNIWGERYRVSLFGESHGEAIGVVIDGIPAGMHLDLEKINAEMKRRAPGNSSLSTPRKESDAYHILSGYFEGRTTGTPLACMIYNDNTKSGDYQRSLLRPGHADYTGFSKYGESHDYRGGGHFSGRITAPLVFAGAIAKQILEKEGIRIGSHILAVDQYRDIPFDEVGDNAEVLDKLLEKKFPVLDDVSGKKMQEYILEKKEEKDSVGGVIECCVAGVPVGIGNPFFGSVESRISSMMFSIPAVKGVEFGAGFDFASMTGSEANDAFVAKDGKILTETNHNGGINGGITNGMPLLFKVAVKPTPSIGKPQKTVHRHTLEETEISIQGRHDPCILPRVVPVVEAGCAIALLDMIKLK